MYMNKVAKLAPSSQVASKRGLTTFNSLSLSSQNGKTKLLKPTTSNFYTIFFLSRVFGCRKKKSVSSEKHHGIRNFYTLFDLNRYHNKMAL